MRDSVSRGRWAVNVPPEDRCGPQSYMHVSVTVLGAEAGSIGRTADHIIGYLEGKEPQSLGVSDQPSRPGSSQSTSVSGPMAVDGYFADSTEAPGR